MTFHTVTSTETREEEVTDRRGAAARCERLCVAQSYLEEKLQVGEMFAGDGVGHVGM